MVVLSRVQFTRKRVRDLKQQVRDKKAVEWLRDARVENNELYFGTRKVVPKEDIDEFLRARVYSKTDAPVSLSRDAGYDFLQKHYLGISRKAWFGWLKTQELHQQQSARPIMPERAGQVVRRRGLAQMDLVESKPRDLKALGRTLPTYFFTLVDLLTGYLVVREIKHKDAPLVTKALGPMLDDLEKTLGRKVHTIQSDHGSEFKSTTLALIKRRGIHWQGVRLGARIEQVNAFFQRQLYSLIRQKRGGKLQRYIDDAVTLVNQTKSRITKFSPEDAVKQHDTVLAKLFNTKRAAPGKKNPRSVPISIGDTVLVLIKAKKGADVGFKSYRAEHYSTPKRVTGRRGRSYRVTGGGHYPRDRLLKVPDIDKKSQALLDARGKKVATEEAKHKSTRAQEMAKIKAKARIAPRRGARVRKKKVQFGL